MEYVLGAVRAVYRPYGEDHADYRPLQQRVLVDRLAAMGQQLFAPPNVKGWPGGREWLNTSTMLDGITLPGLSRSEPSARHSSQGRLIRQPRRTRTLDISDAAGSAQAFDPARLIAEESVSRPEDVVARAPGTCTCPAVLPTRSPGQAHGLRRFR